MAHRFSVVKRKNEIFDKLNEIVKRFEESHIDGMGPLHARLGVDTHVPQKVRARIDLPSVQMIRNMCAAAGESFDDLIPEYEPAVEILKDLFAMHDDDGVSYNALQMIFGKEIPKLTAMRSFFVASGVRLTVIQILEVYEQIETIRQNIDLFDPSSDTGDSMVNGVFKPKDEPIFSELVCDKKYTFDYSQPPRIPDDMVTDGMLWRAAKRLYDLGVRGLRRTGARTIEGDTYCFYHFAAEVLNRNFYELRYIFKNTGCETRRTESL